MRQCELRRECVERDLHGLAVTRIRIRCDRFESLAGATLQIGDGFLVGREDAVLCPHLDRKIAQNEAVLQRERCDTRSREFKCLIGGAVRAEQARERQCDVLRIDTARQLSGQNDADRIRHAQPDAAAQHDRG